MTEKETAEQKRKRLDWTFKRLVIRMLWILVIKEYGATREYDDFKKDVERYLKETE
jgi:hypothetical protein